MKNVRPVSNLSTLSELLERLAVIRLKPHICSSSNWNILQSAYSQGHSTETALCKILDDIIEAAKVSHITALISLDISASENFGRGVGHLTNMYSTQSGTVTSTCAHFVTFGRL